MKNEHEISEDPVDVFLRQAEARHSEAPSDEWLRLRQRILSSETIPSQVAKHSSQFRDSSFRRASAVLLGGALAFDIILLSLFATKTQSLDARLQTELSDCYQSLAPLELVQREGERSGP